MLSLYHSRHCVRPLSRDLCAGTYVTDGSRLLYVVSPFNPSERQMYAFLEDCATLGVHPYSPTELYEMGLRLVRAGDGLGQRRSA